MATWKLEYTLLPFWFFQHKWKGEMAKKMKTHPNTIYNIVSEGQSHPRYGELVENITKTYGKPIKTETV